MKEHQGVHVLTTSTDIQRTDSVHTSSVRTDTVRTGEKIVHLKPDSGSTQLLSDKTRDLYRRDLTYWATWHQLCFDKPLTYPVALNTIKTFIIQHARDGLDLPVLEKLIGLGLRKDKTHWTHASLTRRLAALASAHHDRNLESLTRHPTIRQWLRRIRRHEATHAPRKPKSAITQDILKQLLDSCKTDALHDRRDRALLLVAFACGGRRRSEMRRMQKDHLTPVSHGYLIHVPLNKTDQEAKGTTVPLYGEAAKALDDWLAASGITSGAIFRGINNDGSLLENISTRAIARTIKKRCRLAALNPKAFSAHSIRSGFVTECAHQNIPIGDVMQMTLHRSPDCVQRYYRCSSLEKNPAAHLLEQTN